MNDTLTAAPPNPIVQLAAHKFCELDRLLDRRRDLQDRCRQWQLQGTIQLSDEGIKLCVAGPPAAVDRLLGYLQADPLLAGLAWQLSNHREQPFRGILVKLQRKITAFNIREVDSGEEAEQRECLLAARHAAIARATHPLPGSVAYTNERPVRVPQRCDGMALIEFLAGLKTPHSRAAWLAACEHGQMRLNGEPVAADRAVRTGERYVTVLPAVVEPDVNANLRVLHEDEALIVIDKPAPLPMHACGRYNRNTLLSIVRQAYHPRRPRLAHRLDANTTGVVVLTKSRHFASRLQPQFEAGRVRKHYLAHVYGHPGQDQFTCDAPMTFGAPITGDTPITDDTGAAGARIAIAGGWPSRTEFQVLVRYPDGTTLLDVNPLTGRMNQIRLHLWHLGFPIIGDPVYLAGGGAGSRPTLSIDDPPMRLHALRIQFTHPATGQLVQFETAPPSWQDTAAS